ncbi:uncharacterized protein LOC107274026 isoform X2 [Cephus cinctus]|uniref:Uncharacterized protein LOC107274026 isoform X2 n=1 Tax=Cephus cinctus TaxID=211228 RepID=A0AAJ7RTZ2_CEPCN|nr:uncharacterized protein LOC107274026 isoform X2 [Cephus cinctus]
MVSPRGAGQFQRPNKRKGETTPGDERSKAVKIGKVNLTDLIDREYKKLLKDEGRQAKHNVRPNLANSRATNDNRQQENNPPMILSNDEATQDNEGWQIARKRGRTAASPEPKETPTNNSFEMLQDSGSGATQPGNVGSEEPRETKKNITLSIFVHKKSAQIKDLINLFDNNLNEQNDYRLSAPGESTFVKVTTRNVSTYQKLKLTLTDNGLHFFTHTPKHLKPKSMVLKGINGGFDAADIEEEINRKKEPSLIIKKVFAARFNSTKGRQNFIVQIDHSNKVAELTQIKMRKVRFNSSTAGVQNPKGE